MFTRRAWRLESFKLGICINLFVELIVVINGRDARLVQCLIDVLGREATTRGGREYVIILFVYIIYSAFPSTYTSTFSLISAADLS